MRIHILCCTRHFHLNWIVKSIITTTTATATATATVAYSDVYRHNTSD